MGAEKKTGVASGGQRGVSEASIINQSIAK